MIAALYVEQGGCYYGLPDVDPWSIERDARLYHGPHAVVAHPPCQRWGKYWHGSPAKPHQYKLGDDAGSFASALSAVRAWGGVLEHPASSQAWLAFNLVRPDKLGGWTWSFGGDYAVCHVEQGHYGHLARKATWLLAARPAQSPRSLQLPDLKWGPSPQKIHPRALELHGYEKARRIGMMAMVGGKDKTRIREATPPEFRDVLLGIARSVS